MKIILLRHGKPEGISNSPISASRMRSWIDQYNSASISRHSHASEQDLKIISESELLICSGLKRSNDSAVRLMTDQPIMENVVFREAELPHSNLRTFKIKPAVWAVVFRVFWYLGYSKGVESRAKTRSRAEKAAVEIIGLAEQYDVVALVGHGIFNRFLAAELLERGFLGPRKPSSRYWGVSVYER